MVSTLLSTSLSFNVVPRLRPPTLRHIKLGPLQRRQWQPVIACLRAGRLRSCETVRAASSGSSNRWKARQAGDSYAREAKVAGLKSRAAFKLLQISEKHRIFKKGATVVDLGYAPGSWSQVAVNRCAPGGRVIGVDILPASPPRGVSTIQGDFLAPAIQEEVRSFVSDPDRGRPRQRASFLQPEDQEQDGEHVDAAVIEEKSYVDMERAISVEDDENRMGELRQHRDAREADETQEMLTQPDSAAGRLVDVVLSDMNEPWPPTSGHTKRSLINPYYRLMNTSGMPFRDHAGSMDLCTAALEFAYDTLRTGGHFVCKFYAGAEDALLEKRVRRLFEKVVREKPAASRSESREGFFVALRRKSSPTKDEIFAE